MKRFFKNFGIGIILGTFILFASMLLAGILAGDITYENAEEVLTYIGMILWLGLLIGVGLTIGENNQNMDLEKRKKVLRMSTIIIVCIIVICIVGLVISIIYHNLIGIVMSVLFIVTLGIWLLGAEFGKLALKKDVEKINAKLKTKRNNK